MVLVGMDIPKALELGGVWAPALPPGYLDAGQVHAGPQGHGTEHGQVGPQGHSRLVFIWFSLCRRHLICRTL